MSFGTNEILSLDNKPVSLDGTGCYRDYFVPNTINLDKIKSWIIPDTCQDVVSFSGNDTVVVSGKGGHYEVCYKPFVCNKTGLYKISYDYDIPVLNFYGTAINYQHFGIFITQNEPPGGNMSTYPLPVQGNCNGTHIVVPGTQNNTPNTGSIEYEYRLQAGQTYYLWLPFMNCEDGVQRFFTFSNIKCEEQIEYPQANNLYVSTDGHGYLIPSNKWGNETNSSYLSTSAKQYYNFSGYTSYGNGSILNNIFTYGLGDGGIKAWFSAIHYNITTANDGHGTCTCNKTTATGGETATLGNSPATHYAFNNYQVTGGSVNGSTLTVTSNATAKATFTAKHYSITLQTDGHGKLTCNASTATGNQTVTLTPSYSSYYRFKNYSITGGSVNGNTLTVTANCTAKANFKVNAFTASGGWEKGSDITITAKGSTVTTSVLKYATTGYRTSNVPAGWYSASNRWHPYNASAYKITIAPKMRVWHKWDANYNGRAGYVSFDCIVGSTHSQKAEKKYTSANTTATAQNYYNYSKSFTSNVQNTYSVSSRFNIFGRGTPSTAKPATARYQAAGTSGTWTATGYAP